MYFRLLRKCFFLSGGMCGFSPCLRVGKEDSITLDFHKIKAAVERLCSSVACFFARLFPVLYPVSAIFFLIFSSYCDFVSTFAE